MDEGDVVIGAMGITAVTVLLAKGGINNYRNFVQAHASGHSYEAAVPGFTGGNAVKWILGLGVSTAILLAVAASPDWGKLAAAVAGAAALTTLFREGGAAKDNLYNLFGQSAPSGGQEMSNL